MAKRGRKAKLGGRKQAKRLDLLSIAQLQAILEAKKSELLGEKAELMARVAEIDAVLGGKPAAVRRGRRAKVKVAKVAKAAAPKVAAPKAGERGPRTGATLANTMIDILARAPKPMQVAEMVEAVRQSSYPSKSVHLRSMVNQALSHDNRFRKVRRGVYRLA